MAAYHTRSNSLPSRPHPLIPEFDEQLCRLRISEAAPSSASTSLGSRLSGLQDLHDCVDRLLLLPLNQQAISQDQKRADQILDGSLRILDVCNIAKDVLLQTKESTQQLQSVLRRKRGATDLSSEVKKFLTSRKVVKKAIHKAITNLKCISSKCNKDQETLEIVRVVREVEIVTLGVLESLLSFISGPKSSGWSLISNMMLPKRVEEESQLNEFAMIDAALDFLMAHKMKKSDNFHIGNAQNQLGKLELCVQDLEECVGSLFRRMLKTRVSLLNILNN